VKCALFDRPFFVYEFIGRLQAYELACILLLPKRDPYDLAANFANQGTIAESLASFCNLSTFHKLERVIDRQSLIRLCQYWSFLLVILEKFRFEQAGIDHFLQLCDVLLNRFDFLQYHTKKLQTKPRATYYVP